MNSKENRDVTIAFVGAGQIGTPMAARLIEAGS